MAVTRRNIGRPPTVKESLSRAKLFTDEAMNLDIQDVLNDARYVRNIGRSAAKLSGVALQLEGDSNAKRVVSAAYDTLSDLMHPTLSVMSADAAVNLFTSATTHQTLVELSHNIDSYAFSKLTHEYRSRGDHFEVTQDGLVTQENFVITPEMQARRGGCPYANGSSSRYFNEFTDHIVDTYAQAQRQRMPKGWLNSIGHSYLKK